MVGLQTDGVTPLYKQTDVQASVLAGRSLPGWMDRFNATGGQLAVATGLGDRSAVAVRATAGRAIQLREPVVTDSDRPPVAVPDLVHPFFGAQVELRFALQRDPEAAVRTTLLAGASATLYPTGEEGTAGVGASLGLVTSARMGQARPYLGLRVNPVIGAFYDVFGQAALGVTWRPLRRSPLVLGTEVGGLRGGATNVYLFTSGTVGWTFGDR